MLKGRVAQQPADALTTEASIGQLQQRLSDRESCLIASREDLATAEESHNSAVQVHSMLPPSLVQHRLSISGNVTCDFVDIGTG